ncbi:hypothetical protein SAMN06296241_1345 [Salinimicrobium sediminis]|uniref:Cthe-2314-like HEPN domain-containing protein n=1 Tax=Salinimicrobium sediminis TaxID=1343891 RepID=A0A285X3F0_9FLAO|nr:hypothetical protein [Salinimicrobium sediminis]SOC79808.1 hypothetical protein SAMN06296241_1345 [Salinimicrobium sediminis]
MDSSRKEKLRLETAEAYKAVGEFVVQFEHLSYAMKNKIRHIIGMSKAIDVLLEPYTFRQTIDVLKKLISLRTETWKKDHPDIELYKLLMKDLNKLNNDRNTTIHSMWYIGWSGDKTETTSEFYGHKFNGSIKNSSTKEIRYLTEKCKNLHSVFWTLWSVDDPRIKRDFMFADIYSRSENGFWSRKNIK